MGLNLFKKKGDVDATPVAAATTIPTQADQKRTDETYVQYGTRMCGFVAGNVEILPTFLHKIYTAELQTAKTAFSALKTKLQNQINNIKTSINKEGNNKNALNNQKAGINNQILVLQQQKTTLQGKGGTNIGARLKMILGIIILAIMTVYLFVFYSSTFHSAFFKDFSNIDEIGIGQAMFDASAIQYAFHNGLEWIFICTAPIIFMALGYALHYFMVQENNSKYLKITACVLVTFVFDCILAYSIGKHLYDIEAVNSLESLPAYSLNVAIKDSNIWAVIFCGFVSYIIWGIVLDFTLTAYDDFKTNKSEIAKIDISINQLNKDISDIDAQITKINNNLKDLETELDSLNKQLEIGINVGPIIQAINDFYSGWAKLFSVLGINVSDIQRSNKTVKDFIAQI